MRLSDDANLAIAVRGLTVRYGHTPVLDELALDVLTGSVFALLGRNGAGKSSLVRCLLGQQKPESGSLRLLGMDAWSERRELMKHVGVVPEEPDAPPGMTAAQLIAFCGPLYPCWDVDGVSARLERFGVPRGTSFGRLSKGQKGALMFSLALGHNPELLVLDDPTLGLDVVARDAVFSEMIAELADHGTTILVTTHDVSAIERIADRVGILKQGRLAVEGEMEALKLLWPYPLEGIFTAVVGTGGQAS
jgi:ABC-type multidrug transport system ATPase subunit